MTGLDMAGASQIAASVQASGFSDANKQLLTQSCFTSALRFQTGFAPGPSSTSAPGASAPTQLQVLENILEYLTSSDYTSLDEATNPSAMIIVIATRLVKLGIKTPAEKTIKAASALALCYAYPTSNPSPVDSHSVSVQMKQYLKSAGRRSTALSSMAVYPNSPSQLPQELRNQAYPDEPPIVKILPRMYLMLRLVVLRTRDWHTNLVFVCT